MAIEYVQNCGVEVKEKIDTYHDADWLVDIFTKTDREGKGHLFADTYTKSQLKKVKQSQS